MYKRILLKLSGESLAGESKQGIDTERLSQYAEQVKAIAEKGVQVGIVIGGGNIFRGLSGARKGFDRVKGDQMGMLATVINALALASALPAKAQRLLDKGNVVILAGGTGAPYFTTDTGSSLRALEIKAEVMLKGTRVDGIYTADPEKDPTATKFSEITYDEVIRRGLKVMDLTATVMCKENGMPIYVFNMDIPGILWKTNLNCIKMLLKNKCSQP